VRLSICHDSVGYTAMIKQSRHHLLAMVIEEQAEHLP